MTTPREQEIEKMYERISPLVEKMKENYDINLDGLDPALTHDIALIVLEVLHSDREAVMESSKKISYIYPDFDRNGLVRETADKINEIIDAVNLLSPNK